MQGEGEVNVSGKLLCMIGGGEVSVSGEQTVRGCFGGEVWSEMESGIVRKTRSFVPEVSREKIMNFLGRRNTA